MLSGVFVHILQTAYRPVNKLVENGKSVDIRAIILLKYI